MAFLLNYTREPINEVIYDARLAYSMHLAMSEDGKKFEALNHNSGVLFVRATENEDGSLNAKSIKNPFIFQCRDGYGVVAVRTGADGEKDEESKGSIVVFTTGDFLKYEELGLLYLEEEYIEKVVCVYDEEKDVYCLCWCNQKGEWRKAVVKSLQSLELSTIPVDSEPIREETIISNIEGAKEHNQIEIPEELAERLKKKLVTPIHTGVEIPEQIEVETEEDLKKIKAVARYSDGTRAFKQIDWDLTDIDFSRKGVYQLKGTIHQEHFAFPVAFHRADPCVAKWKDKYYFIATNDADGNNTLYIREADRIADLVNAPEHLILSADTYPGIGGLLWAPELHEVNGELYIFHAATPGEFFCEESYIMKLREGGNPICKEDWLKPRRIVRKDGTDICEMGKEITLDMTCFQWEGEYYVIWSQRQFLPKDLGAWLYIAKLNPQKPWMLSSDPVLLSKPEYGWENNHTFVDEGPFALVGKDRLYITFSAAAIDTSYVVGILTIEKGKNLLDRRNWIKNNYPILTSRSVEGEYGTGHNAYVIDENGDVWNAYHARPGVEGARSSGIRRVHFDIDGMPVLDLTEERDLRDEYKQVTTKLRIR